MSILVPISTSAIDIDMAIAVAVVAIDISVCTSGVNFSEQVSATRCRVHGYRINAGVVALGEG